MPNRREFDHLVNCKFKVEIEGVTTGAFTAVSGIEVCTDVIKFTDGNDILNRKRPGRTTYSNIVLKRGYTASDELWQWYKRVMDGAVERKSASIIVCDDECKEIVRYNLFEAWPCRWKSLVLDATSNGSLIEELESVVEKIERG